MKIFIRAIVVLAILGFAVPVWTTPVLADQVSFWLYDDPGQSGDGLISLSIFNLDLAQLSGQNTYPAILQYQIDGLGWQPLSSSFVTLTLDEEKSKLDLKLVPDASLGSVWPLGQNGPNTSGTIMLWLTGSGGDLSGVIMANNDTMAPIPVPAAFWLFGSGLLGLLGIRRCFAS